jgi:FAD/FMN-containing dehydrogenase
MKQPKRDWRRSHAHPRPWVLWVTHSAGGLSVTMGRAKGWAADHVRAIDVVTADGELRHVSADSGADLFWALRGGKSNFGVVTALEFALFPEEPLYAGSLFFAGTSMTWPCWSMARYKYAHRPATLTHVSSANHRSPGACRALHQSPATTIS